MKIAQIVGYEKEFSYENVWGISGMAYDLIEELVKRGHQVYAFAPQGSKTSAKLPKDAPPALSKLSIWPDPELSTFYSKLYSLRAVKIINEASFDIVHNHWPGFLIYSELVTPPVITTLHGGGFSSLEQEVAKNFPQASFIALSKGVAQKSPQFNYLDVVYNGINLENFFFKKQSENYLAWLGRFDPEKGAHIAIRVAQKIRLPLRVAGIMDTPERKKYFQKNIKPFLRKGKISYLGELRGQKKSFFLAKARVLLNPISWEEPFGLVMIEAMASGTPVIAFRRGSVPEIIIDGKTGFVVKDEKEMIEAVRKIQLIKRWDCRSYVEKNFTRQIMAENYEKAYQKIIERHKNERRKI